MRSSVFGGCEWIWRIPSLCIIWDTVFHKEYNDELQQRTFFKLDKLHSLHISSTFQVASVVRKTYTLRRTTRSALDVALQHLANQSIQDWTTFDYIIITFHTEATLNRRCSLVPVFSLSTFDIERCYHHCNENERYNQHCNRNTWVSHIFMMATKE